MGYSKPKIQKLSNFRISVACSIFECQSILPFPGKIQILEHESKLDRKSGMMFEMNTQKFRWCWLIVKFIETSVRLVYFMKKEISILRSKLEWTKYLKSAIQETPISIFCLIFWNRVNCGSPFRGQDLSLKLKSGLDPKIECDIQKQRP